MVRNTRNKKGGFIGLTSAALARYAIPMAVSYLKSKGKKGKKGKGVRQFASSTKCCKGYGVRRLGTGHYRGHKGGNIFFDNLKKAATKLWNNPDVQKLVNKGKDYIKRNVRYAITNPEQSYKNVRKFITGKGHGGRRTLKVKGTGRMPRKSASVSGVHSASGPGLITMSKRLPPKKLPATQTKKQMYKQIRRTV